MPSPTLLRPPPPPEARGLGLGFTAGKEEDEVSVGNQKESAAEPVVLNIYDLTPGNDYFYRLGFGVFHTGIEEIESLNGSYAAVNDASCFNRVCI